MKVLAVIYASQGLADVVGEAVNILGAQLCERVPNVLGVDSTIKAHSPNVIVAAPSSLQHVRQCVMDTPVVAMTATEDNPEDLARRIRRAVEA